MTGYPVNRVLFLLEEVPLLQDYQTITCYFVSSGTNHYVANAMLSNAESMSKWNFTGYSVLGGCDKLAFSSTLCFVCNVMELRTLLNHSLLSLMNLIKIVHGIVIPGTL